MNEYVTSSFGVNIGTGLMLESIIPTTDTRIDEDRMIPNKVKLSDYDNYYININSLIANIISSYDINTTTSLLDKDKDVVEQVLDKVISEMTIINNLLDINIIYYTMLYGPYVRKQLLKDSKPDTKAFKLKKSIDDLTKKLLISKEVKVVELDVFLPSKKKSLISTSNTIDLLNANKMDLDLLEFHTGVLKQRNKFYTKLNTKVELPFEEVLLFSLGDKKGLINPILSIKERKVLLDALVDKKLKPYNRYNRSFILDIVKDIEVVSKLKQIPSLF